MTAHEIFSRPARRRYRDRAHVLGGNDRWILMRMAQELSDRFDGVIGEFKTALLIGNDMGILQKTLALRGIKCTYAGPGIANMGVVCDEDRLPFADYSFDLVIAIGTLDSVNDVPGALILIRRILSNTGLFMGAMMGAGSLSLLKTIIAIHEPGVARIHPQIDVRGAGDLLSRAGFAMPVADTESVTVRYGALNRLFSDLRANSLTNALVTRRPLTRRRIALFSDHFEASNKIETFAIIYMTGWAPTPQISASSNPISGRSAGGIAML